MHSLQNIVKGNKNFQNNSINITAGQPVSTLKDFNKSPYNACFKNMQKRNICLKNISNIKLKIV